MSQPEMLEYRRIENQASDPRLKRVMVICIVMGIASLLARLVNFDQDWELLRWLFRGIFINRKLSERLPNIGLDLAWIVPAVVAVFILKDGRGRRHFGRIAAVSMGIGAAVVVLAGTYQAWTFFRDYQLDMPQWAGGLQAAWLGLSILRSLVDFAAILFLARLMLRRSIDERESGKILGWMLIGVSACSAIGVFALPLIYKTFAELQDEDAATWLRNYWPLVNAILSLIVYVYALTVGIIALCIREKARKAMIVAAIAIAALALLQWQNLLYAFATRTHWRRVADHPDELKPFGELIIQSIRWTLQTCAVPISIMILTGKMRPGPMPEPIPAAPLEVK